MKAKEPEERPLVIALYGNGYSATFEDKPGIADWGSSPTDALGRLMMKHPEEFGVRVIDKTATNSE
jgi:hypothetical protein